MTWMLRLYPRAWRRRYEAEVAEMIAGEQRSVRLALDLLAGAIDARINPEWTPAGAAGEGETMTRTTVCAYLRAGDAGYRAWASAAWMIGVTLACVLTARAVIWAFGSSLYTEAFLTAAFFIALFVSSLEGRDPRPYSAAARRVILLAGSTLIYGFFLGASLLSESI